MVKKICHLRAGSRVLFLVAASIRVPASIVRPMAEITPALAALSLRVQYRVPQYQLKVECSMRYPSLVEVLKKVHTPVGAMLISVPLELSHWLMTQSVPESHFGRHICTSARPAKQKKNQKRKNLLFLYSPIQSAGYPVSPAKASAGFLVKC